MDNRIKYIEITEERYDRVKTKYKYKTRGMLGNSKYYIARNRGKLEQDLEGLR